VVREPYMEILVRHGKAEFGVAKDSRQFIALMHEEMREGWQRHLAAGDSGWRQDAAAT